MPFSFSHPALILPLTYLPKKWYSLTGLIIGSLAPDFEYFLRMKIQSNYSHSMLGIIWFGLPSGLLISFIFHNIIRNCLFENLPWILKSRIWIFTKFDWNRHFIDSWFIITTSILIGAISHLFWDSFTHIDGFFVKSIPGLTNSIKVFGEPIMVFKILQHSSTVIGGFLITFIFFKLPIDYNVNKKMSLKYWSIMIFLSWLVLFIRLMSGFDYKFIGNLIVTCISAVFIAMALTPLLTNSKNYLSKSN